MAKIIALYNHKGGVSKTTTAFNLGWALANLGLRVGIADLDPQCNLTALVLGLNDKEDLNNFFLQKGNEDIYEILNPILVGDNTQINPVKLCKTKNERLYLIAGNVKMSDVDMQLTLGLVSNSYQTFARQFVGAISSIIRETANVNKLDIVLLDMGPSSTGMNRTLLMGSDYFIIPTSPDFFCYQAVQSLSELLPKWKEETDTFRDTRVRNRLPETPPKMLGIISQKYNKYSGKMAKSYEEWMQKIQRYSRDGLAKSLENHDMVIPVELFKEHIKDNEPYNLINVSDFNSLIAMSQKHSVPIFNLGELQINRSGNVRTTMIKSRDEFSRLFNEFAIAICGLTDVNLPKNNPKK
uniref:Cellulose biosynthesis protein BcsQ n=1 Tax=Candidatus Kentrum sp. MB TaxID=2138164 RepID=A0A451BG72_9GAMM|nr:MAG: Cellulose biosynthesis protein BcsQ [Candidatus Kentron sp. MB]VFK35387.1 MAG: Cellulose biosynthesis protein BcsQ [Candidatus Kentron sp. MB]VFK77272.1 MAG: Cellulose biosynthesis protein BcsQ [Candidatus Kentron sp. MB]